MASVEPRSADNMEENFGSENDNSVEFGPDEKKRY